MTRGGREKLQDEPERRCIVTAQSQPKAGLVRFVVGPDGLVVPDVLNRLPGRGMWLKSEPGLLELAIKKGAFHLALQTNSPIVPVAIKNTDWMMGKKTGVLFPGTIEMTLLPPVETEGRELMEILQETRRAIATEMSVSPA